MTRRNHFEKQAKKLAREKQFERLRELVESSDAPHKLSDDLAEAFVLSAFSADQALIRAFLSKGLSIHTCHKGVSVLHVAARLPNLDFVRQLVELGADTNARDEEETTALIHCIRQAGENADGSLVPEYAAVARFLIERRADVNDADIYSRTALDYACRANRVEMAELLLQHGAEVARCDDGGVWALKSAVEAVDAGLLSLLLQHGANPNCVVGDGPEFTLVRYAAEHGWLEKAELLVAAGCERKMPDGKDVLAWGAEQQKVRNDLLKQLGLQ